MVWFKVDDNLHSHTKPRRAGLEAMGLWTVAGSLCGQHLSDGFVPEWYVDTWKNGRKLAARLVAAGLWDVSEKDGEQGWQFRQWHERNPSRAEVEAKRAATKERVADWRSQKRNAVGNAVTDAVTNALVTPPGNAVSNTAPTRPDPTRPDTVVKRPSSNSDEFDAEFTRFWDVYPRKVGKGQARTAYRSARKKVPMESIAQALHVYVQAVASLPADKIRHPSTWLNGEPWEDDPDAIAPAARRSRHQQESDDQFARMMERATEIDQQKALQP